MNTVRAELTIDGEVRLNVVLLIPQIAVCMASTVKYL